MSTENVRRWKQTGLDRVMLKVPLLTDSVEKGPDVLG
jgi:hypothetical protein